MPLHLLGKKSWNVYNADNIAKVKRDEAAATAREEAEEQRMQEVDAERRIQVLRGLRADAPPTSTEQAKDLNDSRDTPRRERKRRRIAGEDDTERDIRYAQEANTTTPAKLELQIVTPKSSNAPLTDGTGHINLFPMDGSKHNAPKNSDAEAESAKKKTEFEDQYTMRFSNAAGFKQAVGQKPWYHSMSTAGDGEEPLARDAWGNEDPRRKEREKMRIAADDPLAAIHKGVAGLREVERERKRWKEERAQEIVELIESEKQRKRRRKIRDDDDELNGFSLEGPPKDDHSKRRVRSNERTSSTRRRHRNRSRDISKHHSHRHHRSRSREMMSNEHRDHGSSKHEDPMAKLRKERDKREQAEHARAAALLARAKSNTQSVWEKRPGGRYSAQFATT